MKLTSLFFVAIAIVFNSSYSIAQSYNSANYANIGDTVYITKAASSTMDFDTTGVSITWDYTTLVGVSQKTVSFANPTQTGFTMAQFPFIFNTNNVNLAQTDGQSIYVGSIAATNYYDYFKKTTTVLQQSASAYKLVINSNSLNIKNTFSSPDVLLKFPIIYGNIDSSETTFSTNIPNLFYRQTSLKRVNSVDGTGTLKTPYGIFTNVLRVVSVVNQHDSIVVDTLAPIITNQNYREIKFYDASKKYSLLTVRQNLVNSVYVTSEVEFLDSKRYFQPVAMFGYAPVCVVVGDTIHFQNLSQNATAYSWDFADPSSGSLNVSTLVNPTHIFSTDGNFAVRLIAHNDSLSDTTTIPVFVYANLNAPTITISTGSTSVCQGDSVSFLASSTNGGSNPIFRWFKNGLLIPLADSSVFITNLITSGDTISCQLISSSVCLISPEVYSNQLIMSVISPPSQPSIISGPSHLCENSNTIYSVNPNPNASHYSWALPNGWVGQSDSNSIFCSNNLNGGIVGVAAVNQCGISNFVQISVGVVHFDTTLTTDYVNFQLISNEDSANYQWYNNVPPYLIPNANVQSFGFSIFDNFKAFYVVLEKSGCIDTSESHIVFIEGIDEIVNEKAYLEVYPNPSDEILNLRISDFDILGCSYQIVDSQMKIIKTGKLQEQNSILDITDLKNGNYWLVLIKNESALQVEGFIKD